MAAHRDTRPPRRRRAVAMKTFIVGAIAALATLASRAEAQATLSLGTAIASAGVSVSHPLSPSYYGVGIEPSNLFAWLGTNEPNTFSQNLFQQLASYTGEPLTVRVGGNTLDMAVYNRSYEGYYFTPNPQATGPTDAEYFGQNFIRVVNYLPRDTPIVWSLGMAYEGSDAEDMAVQISEDVFNLLTNVKLISIEIGNEPDLYVQNQFRDPGWGVQEFGQEWIRRAENVYNQVLRPRNITRTYFEAACTATTAENRGFRIQDLVTSGVATDNGVWLAGWNQHDYYYYVGVSGYTLTLDTLMDLSTTEDQFGEWEKQVAQANVTGKPYYLREMGSVGPSGLDGISNTFGNAIWTLNFLLYAATLGIRSVQLHLLQESYSAPWHPYPTSMGGQFVRPTYYAYAAMSQIIGARCQTQIGQMNLASVPSGYQDRLVAYTSYHAGNLEAIILINSMPVYTVGAGATQEVTINLDPDMAGRTFHLSVMTAASASATSDVTWNGMSYEASGDGSSSSAGDPIQTVVVSPSGELRISVRDTQVVVANVDSQLGTQNNVVDEQACYNAQQEAAPGNDEGDNTFKATSGFASDLALPIGAIIGISVGGGVAVLFLLGLCIFCCVRYRRRRKRARAQEAASLLPADFANNGRRDRTGAYRSVPLNENGSQPSSEELSVAGAARPGRRSHTPRDSYASYTPSMSNSPMVPGTPRGAYGYGTASPNEMASLSPMATPPRGARSVSASGSRLNPQHNGHLAAPSPMRNISAQTSAAAAAAGVGVGAGGPASHRHQQQQQYQQHQQFAQHMTPQEQRAAFVNYPTPPQQSRHRDSRQHSPMGPRGPPPSQYPRVRRNSLPDGRETMPQMQASPAAAASAHGHGGQRGYHQSMGERQAPRLPVSASMPHGLNQFNQDTPERPASAQRRTPQSSRTAYLDAPFQQRPSRGTRMSYDAPGPQHSGPPSRNSRPASTQGHGYGQ